MAAEPVNLFSRKIDLRGVLTLLRSLAPDLTVTGPDDAWERIEIVTKRRLFRPSRKLIFNHDPEYYDGPDWPRQLLGMQGYFSRFPESPLKADVLRLIGTFRFALATEFLPDREDNDERQSLVLAVARHLDGVIFMPSGLFDASGRVLLSADGAVDPQAAFPAVAPTDERPQVEKADDDSEEREPPSPRRVARRALVLAAVTGRALLEQEDLGDPQVEGHRHRILQWLQDVEVGDELEPDEWKTLQRPVGKLEQQDAINATWRLEGLGVLAWALGRFEMPPQDQLVDPEAILASLGFLDVEGAGKLLDDPQLRSAEDLDRMGEQIFALHWRLRDFSLRPEATDFVKVGEQPWMGAHGIAQLRLINGDLAIGDSPIADAPLDAVQTAQSAAQERHLAINWLHGFAAIYSETDTST